MEAAFAELPLALFTTLAPLGAGAFVALALAFLTTPLTAEQIKKIDRMTLIPLVVVLVGFAASFFHLADPLHAPFVLSGIGHSPLSNEIVVGSVFVVVALVYVVLALMGKLTGSARKGFAVVVAAMALVFAVFTGLAYTMDTIASWNTPLVPVQVLGFALVGGMALGCLVLALSDVLADALKTAFKAAAVVGVLVGLVLAVAGLCGQVMAVSTMMNALTSGADLVAVVMPWLVAGVLCLIVSAVAVVVALRGASPVVVLAVGSVVAVAGIFLARLVFYAVQLSVGLSF